MSSRHFNKAFPTLFLPIEVPANPTEKENVAVLKCFREFLKADASSNEDSLLFHESGTAVVERVLEKMRSMSKNFCNLHDTSVAELSPGRIHSSLEGLRHGEYLGMWVRAQNGVMLLHRPEPSGEQQDIVRVYVWEAQAPNDEVMKNDASVRQACPRSATSVPWEKFHRLPTANLLWELATKTFKATENRGNAFVDKREYVTPMYLTEYFLASLGGNAIPTNTIHGVHKSMRDNIIYSGEGLPWRRAPIWSALKACLHVVCVMETTKQIGMHTADSEVIYKVVVQNFLAFCLDKASKISSSAIVEGSRKIARRAAKIEELYSWKEYQFFKSSTSFCAKIVGKKMKSYKDEWRRKCEKSADCKVDGTKIKPQCDAVHKLTSSLPILTKLVQLGDWFCCLDKNNDVREPTGRRLLADQEMSCHLLQAHRIEIERRFKSWKTEPQDAVGQFHDGVVSVSTFFMDIRYNTNRAHIFLSNKDEADNLIIPLMELLQSYTTIGLEMYAEDPRGCGEIILVSLTLVLILDILACNHYPLLKDHKIGIDPSFLETILLSKVENKMLLFELESYMSERETNSFYPSSIENVQSDHSLGVRFANQDSGMKATLKNIQHQCQLNREEKDSEYEEKKRSHDELRQQIADEGSCSCYWVDDPSDDTRHKVTCLRCTLSRRARRIRISHYQRLLPTKTDQQLSIVFELMQPKLLASQRSAILILYERLCCEDWLDEKSGDLWSAEKRLHQWKTKAENPLEVCALGSERSFSFGGRTSHITDRVSFVVENNHTTLLMSSNQTAKGSNRMVKKLIWALRPALFSVVFEEGSQYKSLERFCTSFAHNENEIIAAKSTASDDISLVEFGEAGVLRAGPRLQLIRLLLSLVRKDISLERDEIVSLIQFMLWQVGPRCSLNQIVLQHSEMYSIPNYWCRQQSEVLKGPSAVKDICEQLLITVNDCAHNWANWNILLNVTQIAMHVFGHVFLDSNEACPKKAVASVVDVIIECRKVAKQWIQKLTNAFSNATDEADKQSKKEGIAFVAAIGTFTFADSDNLLSTSEDIGKWLFFRTLFNAMFTPTSLRQGSKNRSHFFHVFAVAEAIGPRLHRLLNQDRSGLDKFADFYPSFHESTSHRWKQCKSRYWFRRSGDHGQVVHLNIISGILLFNGSPRENLPHSTTSHKVFSRLFDKSTFIVAPKDDFGYRTLTKVDGFFYEFYPPHDDRFNDAPIIVKECENFRAILIPWYLFDGDLPEQLVNDYSHWFITKAPNDSSIRKNCVYFCPKSYKTSRQSHNFLDTPSNHLPTLDHFLTTSSYLLDCQERLVLGNKTDPKLIDIRSGTFQELYAKVFSRLSSRAKIHVSISPINGIMIRIPVLQNIRFSYDKETGAIWSHDYRDLRVSTNQNFGCLVGIRHGLLLEGNSCFENKIFLCPHGRVHRSMDGSVSINIEQIRSPPFFRYEVRPELMDLRSCTKTKVGNLFLANLHAATSGILADPFTSTTGTQRALTILRSGRCSSNFLDSLEERDIKESIIDEVRVLHEIACISYKRTENHNMEHNDSSSSSYDPLCASSALAFLATMLLGNLDNALKLLGKGGKCISYLTKKQKDDIDSRSSCLSRRAYFHYRELYPKDSLLNKSEEQHIFGTSGKKSKSFLALPCYLGFSVINLAQKIGFESQNGRHKQSNVDSLHSLLCSREIKTLNGITGTATLSGGPMQCFASLCETEAIFSRGRSFHHIWLNLYHMCQAQINNDDKKTSLSFLLTWLVIEYPKCETFLRQLLIISTYPNSFPTAPNVVRYDEPHDQHYSHERIKMEVDGHLERHTGSDDEGRPKKYYRNESSERKTRHEDARHEEAKLIESQIRSQWEDGKDEVTVTGFALLASKQDAFKKKINQLFKRWREARMLHSFIKEVTKQLETIMKQSQGPSFHGYTINSLDRDKAVDVRNSREIFNLSTSPNFDRLKGDVGFKAELHNIKPYTFPLKSVPGNQPKPLDVSEISFLNKSTFVNENPEYEEVWKALVMPLKSSLRLARDETDLFTNNFESFASEVETKLKDYAKRAHSVSAYMYSRISYLLGPDIVNQPSLEIQKKAFLWDSVGPYDLLLHCSKESTCNITKNMLISLSISMKHVQRARRCMRQLIDGSGGLRMHLLNDLSIQFSKSNHGLNKSWNAYEYPEFIMFEVDNDLAIRDTQIEVAHEILKERIESVSTTDNRLVQLNMGEGKTAVIMPIVLAYAARGDKVVRATVLPSLYTTNVDDWQYKLGGLLDRRIYPLLCRRDLPLSSDVAKMMLKLCQKIKKERHIIVTVPDHRLSLENKAIELASDLTKAKDLETSKNLHEVLNFLWQHGREFLDESDEILSPKYQLVYTIGAPHDMEGSRLRWEIHSFIYESLARHASSLLNAFGPDVIELGVRSRESEYVGLRLLEGSEKCEEAYNAIKECIIGDILNNTNSKLKITLRREERKKWENCVHGRGSVDEIGLLPDSSRVIALCLRGMLEHGILKIALFKRWRVHYGNHPTREGFKLAVPYRAKDIAAERTEFGHPDVALSLTFAHYFHAGLQKTELREIFERLKRMNDSDAKAEYSNWVGSGRLAKEMEGFASFEGVNIEDSMFFETKLFPVLRKNMRVIRFWLVSIILPTEAKQFPKKLSSTAPDLCRSSRLGEFWTAVTTGFSGTDDLSLLLPPTIVQANMENLKKTNGVQLKNILRQENNHYCQLSREDTSEELLKKVLGRKPHISDINVVLDAGALVLHKSNRDFVQSWLEIRRDMEAAAFFDGSAILVLTQDGALLKFDASLYCEDMSKCLLYLDDIHTRGSDFRLPLNTRAVLTLGKGLQKDKFVQACMRMRQLGRGQSLTFAASREVHRMLENDFSLSTADNKELGYISAILDWTLSNSVKRICNLMPYFVNQMRSTIQKAHVYNKYFRMHNHTSLESIANECTEDEVIELQSLYGHECGDQLMPLIVQRHLNEKSLFGFESNSGHRNVDSWHRNLSELAEETMKRVKSLAPRIRIAHTMLDEEQERELEHEIEKEANVEHLPPVASLKPSFSEGLREVLRQGQYRPDKFLKLCQTHLQPLNVIFDGTSFSGLRNSSNFDTQNVFVTKDFSLTVKGKSEQESWMKNIRWFLKYDLAPGDPVVVVSNFEAEALSNLLASEMRKKFVPQTQFPSLYAYTAITRLQQPRRFLTMSSCEPPVALHVCAGSIHADEELATDISRFLSVHPRPQTVNEMNIWDSLFERGFIERDGFVRPEYREQVGRELKIEVSKNGLFRKNPVKDLQRFYRHSRHLNAELPNSSIGRLLGVSELVSKYDNEDESKK